MAFNLPIYPSFDVKGENAALRWKKWHERLKHVFVGYDIADPARRKALMLSFGGQDLCDLCDSLPAESFELTAEELAANLTVYDKAILVITEHFSPDVNVEFQKYTFRQSKHTQETVQEYYIYLSSLADTCSFVDKDSEIKSQIISGCKSHKLRQKGLSNPAMSLTQLLQHARTLELTESHSKQIEQATSLDAVHATNRKSDSTSSNKTECRNCGFVHRSSTCPAHGKTCSKCGKQNHFAKVCRSKQGGKQKYKPKEKKIHAVEKVETFFLGSVHESEKNPWRTKIDILNRTIDFKIDTGADVSVLSEKVFKSIRPSPNLKSPNAVLQSPGGRLNCLGYFETEMHTKNGPGNIKLYVLEGNTDCLLSRGAAVEFGFVKRLDEVMGKILCTPVKIHLEKDAVPYSQPTARRIPIPMHSKVEEEIKRMEACGVIEKITEPTEWCAPIVPVMKPNGSVRLCTDFKRLNAAVKRERYILPTLEDVVHNLHGSTIFSKLDAASGYWQIPLDESTAKCTTFITPFGRFYYKRLPFGISSASEIFQRTMEEILSGLKGVECYQDDILLHSKTKQEHEALKKLVKDRVKKAGMELNEKKCEYNKESIEFLGHIVDGTGLKPCPSRVEAINNFEAPSSLEQLRRFLGMITYIGRFIPDLSTVIHPLNQLLCKDTAWMWGPDQEESFKKVKGLISKSPTLIYYKASNPTVVSADASSYGLGAVLLQEVEGEMKPVAFASRSLTPAEQRYAQIEKECLASIWACEKFQRYLVGLKHFKILTDHKPLISLINKKDIQDTPIRCQRMLLRLTRFNTTAEYIPGKFMVVADALSRQPLNRASNDGLAEAVEEYVGSIQATWPASDKKLEAIKQETLKDVNLVLVVQHTLLGWPSHKQDVMIGARDFYSVRDELSVHNGLLLRGNRIVIPFKMRKETLKTIHEGHLGINKCRERANRAVWWPGMSKEIKELVGKCRHCLSKAPSQQSETLLTSPLPSFPFEKVAVDLCDFQGHSYLVFVDYYSRFIEIAFVPDITSRTVIAKIKSNFARYGVPRTLISDNGRQFTSSEFRKFSEEWNFLHVTSSPHYPQANGAAERAV